MCIVLRALTLTCTKTQDSYFVVVDLFLILQNVINPEARRIYPVCAYLIQLLFLKLNFTTAHVRIYLFCAFTLVFFVLFMT